MKTILIADYILHDKMNELAAISSMNWKDLATETDKASGSIKCVFYKNYDSQGLYFEAILNDKKTQYTVSICPCYNNDTSGAIYSDFKLRIMSYNFLVNSQLYRLYMAYEIGDNGKSGTITFGYFDDSNHPLPPLVFFWGEGMNIDTHKKNIYYFWSNQNNNFIWEDKEVAILYTENNTDRSSVTFQSINSSIYYSLSHYGYNNIIFTNIFQGLCAPHGKPTLNDVWGHTARYQPIINKFELNGTQYLQMSRTCYWNYGDEQWASNQKAFFIKL